MRNVVYPKHRGIKTMDGARYFKDVQVKDCAITTLEEQRKTQWMENESLVDFLTQMTPAKPLKVTQPPTRYFNCESLTNSEKSLVTRSK